VWLSTLRPVRWLALRAPADHPRDRLGSALAPLRTFDGDVLVVECARDEVVPHAAVMGFVNALDDPDHMSYEVIPDERHQLSTPESQQRFIDLLRRWFDSRPVRDLERAR
jgi:hypothetical protein